jgi:pimeloyl-ACP methyl ester carboxylesterase
MILAMAVSSTHAADRPLGGNWAVRCAPASAVVTRLLFAEIAMLSSTKAGMTRPSNVPGGLRLHRPYERGKIPVVFIHGLWSRPEIWSRMIDELEADPRVRDRYQFWTFGYSTGDSIPYSADLLRQALQEARTRYDEHGDDPAYDQMVLVGHSMGGILAKMMAQESKTRVWQVVSARPIDELAGTPTDRELLRRAFIFGPRPEVRRIICIATPHQGSHVDQGFVRRLGTYLVRRSASIRSAYNGLLAMNRPDFFNQSFRNGLPTSLDDLQWHSPTLMALNTLGIGQGVALHSIIADLGSVQGTDGLVSYDSAHVDGAASELLVPANHLCLDHPLVRREVRRILLEHLATVPGESKPAARLARAS